MKSQFKLTVGLLVVIFLLAIGTYLRVWDLQFLVGTFFMYHWVAIIGGLYLIISVALYAYFKRYSKISRKFLLNGHVFGNLLAVLFISVHFAYHIGRPAEFAPALGTGLATSLLFVIVLVAGILMRFGIVPQKRGTWQLTHVGFALSFFIVVIIHTLKNLGLL